MAISIGTRQLSNGLWQAHAVCSGADMKYFTAKTQDEAYELGVQYLNENYFNLTNEEINKRVELKKASEKS